MAPRYLVRPRAERDLEDQAFYYGTVASAELAYRFLVAAHECFTLIGGISQYWLESVYQAPGTSHHAGLSHQRLQKDAGVIQSF